MYKIFLYNTYDNIIIDNLYKKFINSVIFYLNYCNSIDLLNFNIKNFKNGALYV
ncbi:hypothetical protein HMPREF1143_2019 [Peptoanaerobacter stomatis]|uniref:Uncharacterized protein n=1 Tax=Peptoanaerobacter stomatis TaxID=796937 RepID=J6HMN6_9FIRM|nr:hypothetical protein HMPREF1143_2019 [Peptoanaerobacter stomatis]